MSASKKGNNAPHTGEIIVNQAKDQKIKDTDGDEEAKKLIGSSHQSKAPNQTNVKK